MKAKKSIVRLLMMKKKMRALIWCVGTMVDSQCIPAFDAISIRYSLISIMAWSGYFTTWKERKKHFTYEQFRILISQIFLAEAVAVTHLTSAEMERFIFQTNVANKMRLLCLILLALFWLIQSDEAQRRFWFQETCISLPLTHIIKWLLSQIFCSANFILKINYMAGVLYCLKSSLELWVLQL